MPLKAIEISPLGYTSKCLLTEVLSLSLKIIEMPYLCVVTICRSLPKNCQMMLFSATYDNEVMEFAETIIKNPVTIRLRREEESLENIKQYYVECHNKEDKFQALANVYGAITVGQAMIFCHVMYLTCNTELVCDYLEYVLISYHVST